jgi:SAM-dependent methyltransferase
MDFTPFDTRQYRTLRVREGYREWSLTYESTVEDEMDLRLLRRMKSVEWAASGATLDLACGTGRIGAWLRSQGVTILDGVDFTAEMLDRARARGIYRALYERDIRDTGLAGGSYDLVTEVLADEHLPDLHPLYREAWRLTRLGGVFVIVGFHSHFLMSGIPTHFDSAGGEPVAVESYVHLLSDHVKAAHAAGWTLSEMDEGVVDDEWLARKPNWKWLLHHPVSFSMVWHRPRGTAKVASRGQPPNAS